MAERPTRHWGDLTTRDFEALDAARTVCVLPIAAIEQHGPHLPVSTDATIAAGMIETVLARLPDDLTVLVLPLAAVGKSNEHIRFAGTLTYSAQTALQIWMELGASVARAGLRKLVLVNSHGGNVALLEVAARELRVQHALLAVHANWMRFGYPDGLFAADEIRYGLHGGDIETSLMLHFRPDLVRRDAIADFTPASIAIERRSRRLQVSGSPAFGWIAGDLNAQGAIGDARPASAEKGRLTAEYQAEAFIALLRDIADFPLDDLAG